MEHSNNLGILQIHLGIEIIQLIQNKSIILENLFKIKKFVVVTRLAFSLTMVII